MTNTRKLNILKIEEKRGAGYYQDSLELQKGRESQSHLKLGQLSRWVYLFFPALLKSSIVMAPITCRRGTTEEYSEKPI